MKKHNYGSEIINNAYSKYFSKQKITYEEFIILLSTNDELIFYIGDIKYQIIYESDNVVAMYVTNYSESREKNLNIVRYGSLNDLLAKFKIEGKNIKDIWDRISFD